MTIALVVLAALLGIAATGSAVQKLRRDSTVLAIMHGVGVTDKQIPVLALLEIAGAVGLLIGIWVPIIGIAAAAGLTLYFLGAVLAHVRSKGSPKELAPAAVLFVVALATTILELTR